MRVGVVAVLLVLGVAFATPDSQASQEVTELFRADGTFTQDHLLARTYTHKHNSKVGVCLTGSDRFQAKCTRNIDSVIVVCKGGAAWKYTNIKGTSFLTQLKHCKIKTVCVKCGNNYDNGCPAQWGCGSCVHEPRRCSNLKPTPKQTPKPKPLPTKTPKPDLSCKDKDPDCPRLNCKWFSVRKKCPSKCGRCPYKPKPDPSCKDKDPDCPRLNCKWFSVQKKCPSKCNKCPKPTPEPTPTPKPDLNCLDKDPNCPSLNCKWFSVREKCPSKCGRCPYNPKPDPSCKNKDPNCPNLNCKWFSVREKCPSKCNSCPKPSPTPKPTRKPTPSPNDPCKDYPTEICIAADVFNGSGSQGWKDVQTFVRKTIKAVEDLFDATPDLVSFNGIAFGETIYGATGFKQDGKEVADFFKGISYFNSGSQIEHALKGCNRSFLKPGVNRVVILVTDGNGRMVDGSPLPFQLIKQQADFLKERGARVFTVPIDDDGNEARLKKLSGKKDSDVIHYHRFEKFKTKKSFDNYAKKLVECS